MEPFEYHGYQIAEHRGGHNLTTTWYSARKIFNDGSFDYIQANSLDGIQQTIDSRTEYAIMQSHYHQICLGYFSNNKPLQDVAKKQAEQSFAAWQSGNYLLAIDFLEKWATNSQIYDATRDWIISLLKHLSRTIIGEED